MHYRTRFATVLAVSLCAGVAFAQNTNSGDIRGTVTDSSGAVMPGVTITVLDVDKGVATTYQSNESGLYDTGSIVTDHYTLTFTKPGFDTYVRGPITLNNETLTVNGTLKVGSTSETVQVTDDVPLMETETGTQSTEISEQEMKDLPNFANWENFIILAPGTSGSPVGNGGNVSPGQLAAVNGNTPWYNVLGDGVTMSLSASGNSYDYNFDTIQEVQMITSAGSAQYENGGVIYNQISKGGGHKFHGDAFDYLNNNDLNAAPYGFGQPLSVPVQRQNYYGGSISGHVPWRPISKKLFFFFNYDRQQSYAAGTPYFETVPTAAMMTGDFTGQPTIYDPTTQTVVDGQLVRQTFASEYGNGNKIPATLFSQAAQNIQKYYPAPNVSNPTVQDGITTNNVYADIPTKSPYWAMFYRVDYDITPKNRLTTTLYYLTGPSPQLSNDCPINCTLSVSSGLTAQISDIWTIKENMNNEFRAGLSTQINNFSPESIGEGFPSKLDIPWAKANLFPEVSVNGACCYYMSPGTNAYAYQLTGTPSDVVTFIKGKHILHFGGEFLDTQNNETNWGNIDAGSVSFSGTYTNSTQGDTTTGLPFADFLLGYVNGWSATNSPVYYLRYHSLQAFGQDDIKLRPNLTVNIGMRWEGWTPNRAKYGDSRLFDPTIVNPGANPFGVANTLGAMWYGTTQANGRTADTASVWNIFLPRFGFAWQPKPNTVVRGAIGLYAYNYNTGTSGSGQAFGSSGNEYDGTNGISPVLLLDQDGSANEQGTAGSAINTLYQSSPTSPDALNGQSVPYWVYHTPAQEIWQYNLQVQRQVGANMALSVAYVGSHGFRQEFYQDINQIPEAALGPNDTTGLTNARPYPNFQSITGFQFIGISNYNALQTTIEKRMSSGLDFNFNYTWSKFLNEGDQCAWICPNNTLVQNMYDPRANYGPSGFDIRSMFKGRIIYNLPFGKDRMFLNKSMVLDEVIGGWQTSATIVWQSGNPFTPVMANNTTYAQDGDQFANVVSGVGWYAGGHQIGPNGSWFNVNAFGPPTPGTYGDAGRDSLRGPGLSDINFSLAKTFDIWEKTKFELRVAANNVLNHPSFGLPDTSIGPGHSGVITSLTVGGRTAQIFGKISF